MKNKLFFAFEDYLSQEAERIMLEYLKAIKNKDELGTFIKKTIKPEVTNYWLDIEIRIRRMLMQNTAKQIISNDLEKIEIQKQLIRYSNWCKEEKEKDHKDATQKIVIDIIKDYENNVNQKKSLAELIYEYMPLYLKHHYDSIDSKIIILFLEEELKNKGYKVININPFKIIKINKNTN